MLSSFFHGTEGSESSCVSGIFSCQCSRQEANSNLKIGFSFWGNPRLKVFLLPHSRGGSLLIERHLCAFRLDYKSRAERMELPSPEGNPKLHDRIGNISENRSWEETWKSLVFNQESCQNRQKSPDVSLLQNEKRKPKTRNRLELETKRNHPLD